MVANNKGLKAFYVAKKVLRPITYRANKVYGYLEGTKMRCGLSIRHGR